MGTIKHARGAHGDSAQIACVLVLGTRTRESVVGHARTDRTRTWLVIGMEELLCRLCGAATPYL